MALPKQVQQDVEEIAAYEESLKTEQESAAAPVEQTVQVETPVASPEVPVEVVPEPAGEAPSNVVELKPTAKEVDWEQKYRTLQGMQQADARSGKELKHQFEQLQAELAEMRTVPVVTPSLVSDAETEEFGADLIDVQRRVVKEELTSVLLQVESLKNESKELRRQLAQVDTEVASSSFEQKLALAVPDFVAVNADPKWVAWLDEVDPILRAPRRSVAQAAYERGDVEATASYVDLFKSGVKPPKTEPSRAAEELKSQVAPPKSAPNVAAANTETRVYTEAETGKLFDKVGLLYRQGKTEEASKLDAELTLAYHEGRVR